MLASSMKVFRMPKADSSQKPVDLSQDDFAKLANRERANDLEYIEATVNDIAVRRRRDERTWMDWEKPGGTVLLAELAQDLQGHAYDGFLNYAFLKFWPTANTQERDHLLESLVEALHVIVNERNASRDVAVKIRFEDRAIDTVCRYLEVFPDSKIEAAKGALAQKLKGRLKDIVSCAELRGESSRLADDLSALLKSESPSDPHGWI